MRILAGLLGLLPFCAQAQPAVPWRLTRSQNFEIYSQNSDETTRATLAWFEQLRGFFIRETGVRMDGLPPVRVIAFRSAREYQPYRLRATSDAYYVGTGSRDYIVMATLDGNDQLRIAAHEYAHLALHANHLQLPLWLNEGLAELYSTVQVGERGSLLGGDVPARSQLLRRRTRMPIAQLLSLPLDTRMREDRGEAELFYAQSWELADMLALAPDYRAKFPKLIVGLSSGAPSADVLTSVYGRSLDTIASDAHAHRFASEPLPGVVAKAFSAETSAVIPFEARSMLADLLLSAGDLDRAEAAYRDLARESPRDANTYAALGTLALRRNDRDGARREWKHAVDYGIRDASLCYRYAIVAAETGAPRDEIRPALERAVELKPDYDEARFQLALLEKASAHYEAAVTHLKAIHEIAPGRAYVYWIGLADALNQLGRNDEAAAAATAAKKHARTDEERIGAEQLVYIAQTDLTVQLSRDASGKSQMIATRKPHDALDWNSFIEPGDDIRTVQGLLREIDCGDRGTKIRVVDTAGMRFTLSIPDPTRVLMRNAPPEFVCGDQKPAARVKVDYNKNSVVRGIEFLP